MKHRGSSKIKYQHSMIQGLRNLLEDIESWPEIQSIIPGRIKPTKRASIDTDLRVQYFTPSGLKCIAHSGCAVQEVFFVTPQPNELKQKIKEYA